MELVDLFRRVLSRGHRREAVLHVKPESRDLPAPASEKKRALSEAQRRTLLDVQRLLEEDRFLPRSAWASSASVTPSRSTSWPASLITPPSPFHV